MAKSQEQRIKDAAEVIAERCVFSPACAREIAGEVLKAADRESPQWPTDESVRAYRLTAEITVYRPGHRHFESSRRYLRAGLLEDPIIKAAIAYRDACADLKSTSYVGNLDVKEVELCKTVDDAGL